MIKIKIANLDNLVIKNNDNTKTVLKILQENYIDWMHACGAKGRCTTCSFTLLKGNQNVSELSGAELKYREMGKLDENSRLACQTMVIKEEIEIEVPQAYKLPHIQYSY